MTEWIWITDRQPTKEDEDRRGEVLMQRFPDGRKSSSGLPDALVAAAHVGPGVPWMHTGDWEPPATPEPEPEAPKPAPKPELRVGQVWRSREGRDVTIEKVRPGATYPFDGSNGRSYTSDGRWQCHRTSVYDLVELITDAPAEAPQPEPTPATRKVPRLFAEPPRRTFSPSGAPQWDALADDGTAWKWSGTLEEWDQHQPLPDREEPINA